MLVIFNCLDMAVSEFRIIVDSFIANIQSYISKHINETRNRFINLRYENLYKLSYQF